jgi:hypothetical protein
VCDAFKPQADWKRDYQDRLPFALPKEWFGMLLVLKRSSDGDVC